MNYEAKVLAKLRKMVEDEAGELRRAQVTVFVLALVGWSSMFAAFFGAFSSRLPLMAIAIAGVVGGICAGFSIMLNAARRQWPIIKPFINVEAITKSNESAP